MVHTKRPSQDKMALFWHNHFATGYGKIAGQLGATGLDNTPGNPTLENSGLDVVHETDFRSVCLCHRLLAGRQFGHHPGR